MTALFKYTFLCPHLHWTPTPNFTEGGERVRERKYMLRDYETNDASSEALHSVDLNAYETNEQTKE